VRNRNGFALAGYVVMPNHIHLLIGESYLLQADYLELRAMNIGSILSH
jgi:REP element-mobilizing transposase RayT